MSDIPAGLVEATQRWVDLRDERTRVTEDEDGELDYDTLRQFEDEQATAATDVADLAAGWLSGLGKLR